MADQNIDQGNNGKAKIRTDHGSNGASTNGSKGVSTNGAPGLEVHLKRFLSLAPDLQDCSQYKMSTVLEKWQRIDGPTKAAFRIYDAMGRALPDEVGGLRDYETIRRSKPVPLLGLHIAMALYENPWSPGGGLCIIGQKLPQQFNALLAADATRPLAYKMFRISPLHLNATSDVMRTAIKSAIARADGSDPTQQATRPFEEIPKDLMAEIIDGTPSDCEPRKRDQICLVGTCQTPFGFPDENGKREFHTVNIFRAYSEKTQTEWYLFNNENFFKADVLPYDYRRNPWGIAKDGEPITDNPLKHDAMFASRALIDVFATLGLGKNLVINPQDWQFDLTCLTAKEGVLAGQLQNVAVVPTHHNIYDQKLTPREMSQFTDRYDSKYYPGVKNSSVPRNTICEIALPMADLINMVSEHLVLASIRTPNKTGCTEELAHILETFNAGGIFNGTYEENNHSLEIINAATRAKHGQVHDLGAIKNTQTEQFLATLGRDLYDQRLQSAKDGVERVIGKFREETGTGAPIKLAEGVTLFGSLSRACVEQKGIDCLLEALDKIPENVDYRMIIGAPGFLEPRLQKFLERAKEIVDRSDGKIVIVTSWVDKELRDGFRKGPHFFIMPSYYEPTGMVTEINIRLTPCLAHATVGLQHLVVHYDELTERGTGILYGLPTMDAKLENKYWKEIREAMSPAERMKIDMYNRLSATLGKAITEAHDFHANGRDRYIRMLANLPESVTRFSWMPAVADYANLFEKACS
jgi:glycogen synthase